MWRYRYEYMHVIPRYVTLDDLYIVRPAYLANQIPRPLCYVRAQYGLAVFRNPHKVIFDVIYGMA